MATDRVTLNIYVRNIACASRDEEKNPLAERLVQLIDDIKTSAPDVAVLLEAGRSSKEWSWSRMAEFIETQTGLTYMGLSHANASERPFAHAVFVQRKTGHVVSIANAMSYRTTLPGGVQATIVTVKPVAVGAYPHDCVSIGAIHMPMGIEGRRAGVEWLVANKERASFWAGDFNTFPDDIGPWMMERLEDAGFHDVPCTQPYTFSAFTHDTLTVPIEKRELLHPMCELLEETETHVTVRPVSVLDHVFTLDNILVDISAAFLPPSPASDHCAMLVTAKF